MVSREADGNIYIYIYDLPLNIVRFYRISFDASCDPAKFQDDGPSGSG